MNLYARIMHMNAYLVTNDCIPVTNDYNSAFDRQQQQQGNRESSSTRSTFATRGETGEGERRERMGVTARIGVAMGEARGEARMWVQQLGERMKRLGDGAKRWLWRDAG